MTTNDQRPTINDQRPTTTTYPPALPVPSTTTTATTTVVCASHTCSMEDTNDLPEAEITALCATTCRTCSLCVGFVADRVAANDSPGTTVFMKLFMKRSTSRNTAATAPTTNGTANAPSTAPSTPPQPSTSTSPDATNAPASSLSTAAIIGASAAGVVLAIACIMGAAAKKPGKFFFKRANSKIRPITNAGPATPEGGDHNSNWTTAGGSAYSLGAMQGAAAPVDSHVISIPAALLTTEGNPSLPQKAKNGMLCV